MIFTELSFGFWSSTQFKRDTLTRSTAVDISSSLKYWNTVCRCKKIRTAWNANFSRLNHETFHLVPLALNAECFLCFSEIQAYNISSHSKTWLSTREEFTRASRLNKSHVIKSMMQKITVIDFKASMQQCPKICYWTLNHFSSLDELFWEQVLF